METGVQEVVEPPVHRGVPAEMGTAFLSTSGWAPGERRDTEIKIRMWELAWVPEACCLRGTAVTAGQTSPTCL